MKLYLLRHTKPAISKPICYGHTDVDVAESYKDELTVIKDKFVHIVFDRVFSSPLLRCKKLADDLSTNVYLDNRLCELNFGDWEGLAWNDIYNQPEGKTWFDNYLHCTPPNGESFLELLSRVREFTNSLSTDLKNILIVAHAGIIRAFLVLFNLTTLEKAFTIPIPYGHLTCIENFENTYFYKNP